jgi:hypothetical protein
MNIETSTRSNIDGWRCSAIGSACAVLFSGSLGCSGEALEQRDLGNTGTELEAGDPGADRQPVILAEAAVDPFIEGRWVGHAEDPFAPSGPDGERRLYTFPSGSTEITLELFAGSSPGGQITFGSGPVPVPQSGVGYPARFAGWGVQLPPVEGFSYPLQEHILRTTGDEGTAAGVLSLEYVPNAAYESWCPLQTPRDTHEGTFDCVGVIEPDEPAEQCGPDDDVFECNLYNLCLTRNLCTCNEAKCWLAPVSPHGLWLTRDGEELLVSFVGAVFDYGTPGRYMPVGLARFERMSE